MNYLVIMFFAAVSTGLAAPPFATSDHTDLHAAAASGKWEDFQKIFENIYRSSGGMIKPLSADVINLRTYRARDGEKFYGESDSQFHYQSNLNGQKDEKSGGHRIVNDNGKVEEYEYTPRTRTGFGLPNANLWSGDKLIGKL